MTGNIINNTINDNSTGDSEQSRLLNPSRSHNKNKKTILSSLFLNNKRKIITMTCILVIVILTFLLQLSDQSPFFKHNPSNSNHNKKKNVIFFVTDGMGPASLSLTRSYRQFVENLPINDTLILDNHLIGSSRTRSFDSLITDSAAGATAFSCALKTYNSAVGVNHLKQPCGTILEAAKLNGYMTGLVVTTRITDATPAAFSSHTDFRIQEDLIAQHQIGEYPLGEMVDLMIGGGKTHFHSQETGGSRKDGRNLINEIERKGWQIVNDRKSFDYLQLGKNVSLPLCALMAEFDIPFEIDRDDKIYPSLEEQTITALNALSKATEDSGRGFFLLVEGSRIDHAGHQNDPAAQVREVLAFDKAFKAAIDFADNSDTETILISTSDHETGGLVTARQVTVEYPEYIWLPQVLANSSHSGEFVKEKIFDLKNNHINDDIGNLKKLITNVLENDLGILNVSEGEINDLINLRDKFSIQDRINGMISFRAQIGWTTHGHSAVDVNIYAYSNNKRTWYDILDHLQGNHENIEIGKYMAKYMNLNLNKVTSLINGTKHSPDINIKDIDMSTRYDQYHHILTNEKDFNLN